MEGKGFVAYRIVRSHLCKGDDMRRLFLAMTATLALAVPASLVAIGSTAPAGAASSVSCKKLTGSATGTFTISKCSPKSKTNKTASGTSANLATGGGTITWSPSNGTTTVTVTFNQATTNGCKKGSTEYDVQGSVTGGNSTYTKVGDAVSGRACLSGSGALSLVKKTSLTV